MRRKSTSINTQPLDVVTLAVTESRDLASSDMGFVLEVDPAGGTVELTIPAGLSSGWNVRILQVGDGAVLLPAGAGATVQRSGGIAGVPGQWSSVYLFNRGNDVFVLSAESQSATGSVYIDVSSFGAFPDGPADNVNTEAFNDAIAFANDRGGGTVVCSQPGTYLINADWDSGFSIQMLSDVTLELKNGVILQAITNALQDYAVIRSVDQVNVAIIGGEIIGDRATHTGVGGEWGHGIELIYVRGALIRDTLIRDCWGDGLFIGHGVNKVTQPRCEHVAVEGVRSVNNRRQGCSVVAARWVSFEGCSFENTNGTLPQAGIDLEPNSLVVVEDVAIVNCFFINNLGAGLSCIGAKRVTASNCLASGNGAGYFCGIAASAAADIEFNGCIAENSLAAGFDSQQSSNISYVGCRSNGNAGRGFRMLTIGGDCRVIGCVASDNVGTGFDIQAAPCAVVANNIADTCGQGVVVNTNCGIFLATSNGAVVTGNKCLDCYVGIAASGDGVVLTDNVVESSAASGIRTPTGGSTYTRCVIANNISRLNGEHGIRVNPGSNNLVIGNYSADNSQSVDNIFDNIEIAGDGNFVSSNVVRRGVLTNAPRYGIRVLSGTSNVLVNNDTITGGDLADVFDSATTTRRVVTGTSSLNFGTVNAGVVGTAAITVAGAVADGVVSVSAPAALAAGLIWSASVTAANTVTVRLFNTTGGNIAVTTANWTAIVQNP